MNHKTDDNFQANLQEYNPPHILCRIYNTPNILGDIYFPFNTFKNSYLG